MQQIKYFSNSHVTNLISMSQAIEQVRKGFEALSNGKAIVPLRTSLKIDRNNGNALIMPVYISTMDTFAIKTVNIFNDNKKHKLPTTNAIITLFSAKTGLPLAVMEAELITALRTGAASGLATKILSKKASNTVAIFGAGVQGEFQLKAVNEVRNIKRVYVFDVDKNRAINFSTRMKKILNIQIDPVNDIEKISEVDIVCTATTSCIPVFKEDFINSGTHINGVGSYKPNMMEIPPEVVKKSKIYVDSIESCLAEAGDIVMPLNDKLIYKDDIVGEIGDLSLNKIEGRKNDKEITFFKSVGNGVQDLVIADFLYKKSINENFGSFINI